MFSRIAFWSSATTTPLPRWGLAIGALLGAFLTCGAFTGRSVLAQVSTQRETSTPLYSSNRSAVVPVKNVTSQARLDAPRVSTIDASTRWQFVSRESVAIDSSIIRLGDVIRPLQPDLVAWKRLAGATIGLMPADGGDAKVSRDRLADLISRAEATPERIKIYGPETILVRRLERTAISAPQSTATQTPGAPSSPMVSRTQYLDTEPESLAGMVPEQSAAPPIDYEQLERLQQYVLAMVRNQHREIYESFELKIDFDPEQLPGLAETQGVRHLTFLDEVPVWSHTLSEPIVINARVDCRAVGKDCRGTAQITLRPYPAVVTARTSLRRGQRVGRGDLQYLPYSSEGISLPSDIVERPEDIVDLEVVGLVRGGVPLSYAAFAAPRVIRRGDLLEVQVGGGGVRVTTGAKALGDGAVNDLIEIETLSPKRRLLAKVVHSTLVEIVTQAPRVRAEPSSRPLSGSKP